MRDDPVFHEALYCIRCSACMNVCANFQIVGGHAFGGECYTGGIGGAWTAGTTGDVKNARFADLCTGCSRCIPNCPVQINIPGLNTEIKSRIIKEEGGANFQKQFFGNFSKMAKLASTLPGLANKASEFSLSRKMMEKRLLDLIQIDLSQNLVKRHLKKLIKNIEIIMLQIQIQK
ncbi:MAG: lactate utilization protein [Ignavibacteriales bacterium]|nr:lactate utilization protein [Ignavibacteriales bacterium]